MRLLPQSVVNWIRQLQEHGENVRRGWREWRGYGDHVSVAAVRKAQARVEAEQTILMHWDGVRAHPKRRAKLRPAISAAAVETLKVALKEAPKA